MAVVVARRNAHFNVRKLAKYAALILICLITSLILLYACTPKSVAPLKKPDVMPKPRGAATEPVPVQGGAQNAHPYSPESLHGRESGDAVQGNQLDDTVQEQGAEAAVARANRTLPAFQLPGGVASSVVAGSSGTHGRDAGAAPAYPGAGGQASSQASQGESGHQVSQPLGPQVVGVGTRQVQGQGGTYQVQGGYAQQGGSGAGYAPNAGARYSTDQVPGSSAGYPSSAGAGGASARESRSSAHTGSSAGASTPMPNPSANYGPNSGASIQPGSVRDPNTNMGVGGQAAPQIGPGTMSDPNTNYGPRL